MHGVTELGFSRHEAVELAIEVWRGFLGIEVEPVDEAEPAELPPTVMCAGITLKGEWYGGVLLAYPLALADQAARLALGIDNASIDDMRDVVGEIVNMMTGRLKYYMPGKTEMSLPIVATGDTLGMSIPGSSEVMALDFRIEGVPFRLQVVCTDA
jgi:CheY-specific phosphatase CheX